VNSKYQWKLLGSNNTANTNSNNNNATKSIRHRVTLIFCATNPEDFPDLRLLQEMEPWKMEDVRLLSNKDTEGTTVLPFPLGKAEINQNEANQQGSFERNQNQSSALFSMDFLFGNLSSESSNNNNNNGNQQNSNQQDKPELSFSNLQALLQSFAFQTKFEEACHKRCCREIQAENVLLPFLQFNQTQQKASVHVQNTVLNRKVKRLYLPVYT
jgi:hypothetical protein